MPRPVASQYYKCYFLRRLNDQPQKNLSIACTVGKHSAGALEASWTYSQPEEVQDWTEAGALPLGSGRISSHVDKMGLACYYQKFIPHFTDVNSP